MTECARAVEVKAYIINFFNKFNEMRHIIYKHYYSELVVIAML
jgi:hypothetical protein